MSVSLHLRSAKIHGYELPQEQAAQALLLWWGHSAPSSCIPSRHGRARLVGSVEDTRVCGIFPMHPPADCSCSQTKQKMLNKEYGEMEDARKKVEKQRRSVEDLRLHPQGG